MFNFRFVEGLSGLGRDPSANTRQLPQLRRPLRLSGPGKPQALTFIGPRVGDHGFMAKRERQSKLSLRPRALFGNLPRLPGQLA